MARIRGDKAHAARLRRLTSPAAVKEISQALFIAGSQIEADWATSITNGAISGKGHIASLPGEPPNADTHVYDRSIQTVLTAPLHVQVYSDDPKAKMLEFGTSKMAARPAAAPAAAKNHGHATETVRDAVNRVVRRAG